MRRLALLLAAGSMILCRRVRAQEPAALAPGPDAGSIDGLEDLDPSADDNNANPYLPRPGVKLDLESVLKNWELGPTRLAREIARKYGPPDTVTPRALIWHHRQPWERIVVRQDAAAHNFPFQHSDWLEQTIRYRVPAKMFGPLAQFDGSLLADRTRGELTARSDSEGMNFIALNLADQIVRGQITADKARQVFGSLARNLYAKGLAFGSQENSADADVGLPAPKSQ